MQRRVSTGLEASLSHRQICKLVCVGMRRSVEDGAVPIATEINGCDVSF